MSKMKLDILPSDKEMQKNEQKIKRKELIITEPHTKRFRLSKEERIYTAEELAFRYIKVGLTRDSEMVSEEIILTRNGVRKENIEGKIATNAISIVKETINKILKRLERMHNETKT